MPVSLSIRADTVGVRGSGPHRGSQGVRTSQNLVVGVFCGSDPHENFTEISKINTRSGFIRLQYVLIRPVAEASPRTPLSDITAALPRLLAVGEGNTPSQEPKNPICLGPLLHLAYTKSSQPA